MLAYIAGSTAESRLNQMQQSLTTDRHSHL